jgi:glycerol uptake facilitator-like aquaporin
MSKPNLSRRLFAEGLGTALLLATVVGSGIMGSNLSGGNVAIALLGNTIPTGAMLVVLITILGPVSGAHFNPVVSIAFAFRRELTLPDTIAYIAVQFIGAVLGVYAAHFMFDLDAIQSSTHIRTGSGQWFSEVVATFGLLLTIFGCLANSAASVPFAVGLYITAAYWFSSSTSFANPAVTFARSMTDTFSGIAPADVFGFIVAQIIGMVIAIVVSNWVFHRQIMK